MTTPATTPSVAAASFSYAGGQTSGFEAGDWRVAAASVTGLSHEQKGTVCQDAAAAGSANGWLVAVVCDGAGSAERSAEASATVAKVVVEWLLSGLGGGRGRRRLRDAITSALEAAREQIVSSANASGLRTSAFATTVVGALCRGRRGVFFHLGDGTAMAFDRSQTLTAISHGSPKEYANETYFLSDDSWRDFLRVTPVRRLESVLLMTDGVTPFAVEAGAPKPKFVLPILQFLSSYPVEAGSAALQRLLGKPAARTSVSDDKTLLWASTAAGSDGKDPR
jgi:serine/threonine protein phosphatase PrpC